EKLGKESKEAKQVLDYEANLKETRTGKDTILREIGRLEGEIRAEERVIEHEKRLSAESDLRTVRLKEVEALFDEVSVLSDLKAIFERLKRFITERKHATDSE